MLDIIATEAIEGPNVRPEADLKPVQADSAPSVQYDLRLVKHPDGRLEWRD